MKKLILLGKSEWFEQTLSYPLDELSKTQTPDLRWQIPRNVTRLQWQNLVMDAVILQAWSIECFQHIFADTSRFYPTVIAGTTESICYRFLDLPLLCILSNSSPSLNSAVLHHCTSRKWETIFLCTHQNHHSTRWVFNNPWQAANGWQVKVLIKTKENIQTEADILEMNTNVRCWACPRISVSQIISDIFDKHGLHEIVPVLCPWSLRAPYLVSSSASTWPLSSWASILM